MAKTKRYLYLVDNLTVDRSDMIEKGLKALTIVEGVSVDVQRGLIEVLASRNPDTNVDLACAVAGSVIRTKIKKHQL